MLDRTQGVGRNAQAHRTAERVRLQRDVHEVRTEDGLRLTVRVANEVAGLGAPTLENLSVFIFAQVHKQIPQVSAVAVSRAAGDRCVYRPQA